MADSGTTTLRAVGLCGADDSVHPNMLGMICKSYPFVEFGVLFRPDKEGEPRYATTDWVGRLSRVAKKVPNMKLAAHLCERRVNDVLKGGDAFLEALKEMGFERVQINATARNGADTSLLGECVETFCALVLRHPTLEFILQKNEETRKLWEGLLNLDTKESGGKGGLPSNVSMLVDESKGTGALASSWPNAPEEYRIGYAGGIGPSNIDKVLKEIREAGRGRAVWIDMESRVRSTKDGKEVFDLDKCYQVIDAVCAAGFHKHPEYLNR